MIHQQKKLIFGNKKKINFFLFFLSKQKSKKKQIKHQKQTPHSRNQLKFIYKDSMKKDKTNEPDIKSTRERKKQIKKRNFISILILINHLFLASFLNILLPMMTQLLLAPVLLST